ncbi:unnamed protein product [Natator depressus]
MAHKGLGYMRLHERTRVTSRFAVRREGLILHLQLLSISLDNGELAKAVVLTGRPSESKMDLSTPVSGLSLPWLVLLLLLEIPGAGAQEFQLLQPPGAVCTPAGEALTLTCFVTGLAPVGPVKWFKGSGGGRQLVYAETGSFPRVTRAASGSDTDFTIHINDTRPADAGTYRCVKFKRGSGADEEIRSGAGTAVSVSASPSAPSVSGPPSRAEPGPSVTFTCTSGGFSPRDITGQSLFSSPALWIGLFLEKMLSAAFLLFLFLRTPSLFPRFLTLSPPANFSVSSLCPRSPGKESLYGGAAVTPAGECDLAQAPDGTYPPLTHAY